jgi:hypothetical protein
MVIASQGGASLKPAAAVEADFWAFLAQRRTCLTSSKAFAENVASDRLNPKNDA